MGFENFTTTLSPSLSVNVTTLPPGSSVAGAIRSSSASIERAGRFDFMLTNFADECDS
jgi:hypothetical protein